MGKILRKRVLRDLKNNYFRYFALFLLIVMGMYLIVSMVGAAETIIQNVDKVAKDTNLEDGEFSLFVPLTNKQTIDLEDKGITLEKMFYLDYLLKDGSTIRIYKNRENINQITLDKGRMVKDKKEAVIEKRYSEEHNLSVGDSIQIDQVKYKIVGIGTVADYDAVLKNMSDTSVDSKQFGLAFVTKDQYKELSENSNYSNTEEYIYSYRLHNAVNNEELKSYLSDLEFNQKEITDTYFLGIIKEINSKKMDIKDGITNLVDGSKNLNNVLEKLNESNSKITEATLTLPNEYSEIKSGISQYLNGEETAYEGSFELLKGLREFQEKTNELLDESFATDIDNLTQFVKADENPRIKASSNDVLINKMAGLVAGVIIMVLFTYVISVFVIHSIEKESSIIGTLYALGVKKKELVRHYLTLPVIITLLAGLIGTGIGFSKYGIDVQMKDTFEYSSLPTMNTIYPLYLIIYGIIMPPVIAILVNYGVISRKLSQPVLKMIQNEQKSNKYNSINLGNLKFIRRFQIRQLLRESRTSITVVFGMFIALLIMMMGIDCYVLTRNMSVDNKEDTKYKYMYTYKYPEDQVPIDGEEAYMESLTKVAYGYNLNVTLMGINDDNPYYNVDVKAGKNKVVVASSTAEKYNLKVGDKLVLTDEVKDMDYAFTVEEIVPYSVGLYVFMDIDSMRELFEKEEDYYNVVLSSKAIDIDANRLYAITTKEDISKSSDVFIKKMMPMIILMIIVSIIIFCVVMYLMMKVMIDRSAFSISLIKIFGFRPGEVRKIYLSGNFYIILLSALFCIPLAKKLMDIMYPYLISNVAVGMNLIFTWELYLGIYAGVILCYLVINQILVSKLKKLIPADVIKNRE